MRQMGDQTTRKSINTACYPVFCRTKHYLLGHTEENPQNKVSSNALLQQTMISSFTLDFSERFLVLMRTAHTMIIQGTQLFN
jgi:hypothetical protein